MLNGLPRYYTAPVNTKSSFGGLLFLPAHKEPRRLFNTTLTHTHTACGGAAGDGLCEGGGHERATVTKVQLKLS